MSWLCTDCRSAMPPSADRYVRECPDCGRSYRCITEADRLATDEARKAYAKKRR